MTAHDHDHTHDHTHEHDDGEHAHHHPHPGSGDHDPSVSEYEVLERALRELMIEKGIITADEVHAQIDLMDSRSPSLGASVVAKAWTEPAFKKKLMQDARAALAGIGIDIGQLAEVKVVENTPSVHNVIVCTLCSCYPKLLLGIPPAWYKSAPYRQRVVIEPRAVLKEFGVDIAEDVEVRVHDSTADLRYLVLPQRPKGTQGWTAKRLAKLVTRDCMIGTGLPLPAAAKGKGTRPQSKAGRNKAA